MQSRIGLSLFAAVVLAFSSANAGTTGGGRQPQITPVTGPVLVETSGTNETARTASPTNFPGLTASESLPSGATPLHQIPGNTYSSYARAQKTTSSMSGGNGRILPSGPVLLPTMSGNVSLTPSEQGFWTTETHRQRYTGVWSTGESSGQTMIWTSFPVDEHWIATRTVLAPVAGQNGSVTIITSTIAPASVSTSGSASLTTHKPVLLTTSTPVLTAVKHSSGPVLVTMARSTVDRSSSDVTSDPPGTTSIKTIFVTADNPQTSTVSQDGEDDEDEVTVTKTHSASPTTSSADDDGEEEVTITRAHSAMTTTSSTEDGVLVTFTKGNDGPIVTMLVPPDMTAPSWKGLPTLAKRLPQDTNTLSRREESDSASPTTSPAGDKVVLTTWGEDGPTLTMYIPPDMMTPAHDEFPTFAKRSPQDPNALSRITTETKSVFPTPSSAKDDVLVFTVRPDGPTMTVPLTPDETGQWYKDLPTFTKRSPQDPNALSRTDRYTLGIWTLFGMVLVVLVLAALVLEIRARTHLSEGLFLRICALDFERGGRGGDVGLGAGEGEKVV